MRAIAVAADVSRMEEAARLVDATLETFGRIDVLVNNAGITRDGLIAKMDEASFDEVIDVNLKGTFNCCKAVTRTMMKQRGGRIVNLSSVVGVKGNAGQANYAASKAGVIGLTLALAKELAPRDITVNAIAPGFIETDMTHVLGEKARASIADRIGLRRLGETRRRRASRGVSRTPRGSLHHRQVICVGRRADAMRSRITEKSAAVKNASTRRGDGTHRVVITGRREPSARQASASRRFGRPSRRRVCASRPSSASTRTPSTSSSLRKCADSTPAITG